MDDRQRPWRRPIVALLSLVATGLFGQAAQDLDAFYAYPVAAGTGYASYTGLTPFSSGFRFTDVAAEVRVPVPGLPSFQPLLRGGILSASLSGSSSTAWNHTLTWGGLGVAYSRRFNKSFEVGLDASFGLGQSSFPDLVAGGPVGSLDLVARGGARLGLLPANSFSVEIVPDLAWRKTLGPLTEFDGFSYGLGLRLVWRFGDDPDAPAKAYRSLRFSQDRLPPVFSAMQGYYSRNPVGKISVTNSDSVTITDLELTFFQPGYMDSPTPVGSLSRLEPTKAFDVGITASFNQEVFRTEGMTPLVGTLTAKYRVGGRPVEQSQSLSYDLYDKTSIVWDDDRKVGAFITPADSALRNYVSFVRQTTKSENLAQWNGAIQTAAAVWSGLTTQGILYQADPTSPFTRVQAAAQLVDSVNVARQTLVRGTGDCDDLTVLFDSLLETAGVDTAFITVPGHIFAAFQTKVAAQAYRTIHPDRSMTIAVGSTLWIPVEITLVGKEGFLGAWQKGAELWHLYDQEPSKRNFTLTQEAQAVFSPVSLRESDLGLQYGNRDSLLKEFRADLGKVTDSVLTGLSRDASAGDPRDWNSLGMAYVRFGRLKEGEIWFQKALKADPNLVSAQINLGNVAFLQKDFKRATQLYQAGYRTLETQGRATSPVAQLVLVNLSKTYNAAQNFPEAKLAFSKAEAIDADAVKEFGYLAQVGAGSGSRASEQTDGPLFPADGS